MNLDSYKKVYDRYFNLARRAAQEVLDDYYLAGDVAQEVFIEMYLKKEFLEEEQIKYWIILNANRRAIDLKRKLRKQNESGTVLEDCLSCGSGNIPEALVLRSEETKFRFSALEELREYNGKWYDVLMRSSGKGESYQNLAQSYHTEETTLRVWICRARKWLDNKIRELYGD